MKKEGNNIKMVKDDELMCMCKNCFNDLMDRVIDYLSYSIECEKDFIKYLKKENGYDDEYKEYKERELSDIEDMIEGLEMVKVRTEKQKEYNRNDKPYQIELLDGVEQNKKHPTTFHIPSKEEKDSIQIGTHVKVADTEVGERFWVEVDDIISDDLMIGRIDNVLISNQPYNFNDRIYLTKDNFIDILDIEE